MEDIFFEYDIGMLESSASATVPALRSHHPLGTVESIKISSEGVTLWEYRGWMQLAHS